MTPLDLADLAATTFWLTHRRWPRVLRISPPDWRRLQRELRRREEAFGVVVTFGPHRPAYRGMDVLFDDVATEPTAEAA